MRIHQYLCIDTGMPQWWLYCASNTRLLVDTILITLIHYDQANYTVAEGSSLTVTGRLTGLTGELQSNFSLTLSVDFSVDTLTGKPLMLDSCTTIIIIIFCRF